MNTTSSEKLRNFSRIDPSGTDPNRYASVAKTADTLKKGILPGMPVNVSTVERVAMIAAGGFLLYKAFASGNTKNYA
ncbi:MAG: hypothetical protein EOO10_24780, partial [Chitinophagaceae bacterium]